MALGLRHADVCNCERRALAAQHPRIEQFDPVAHRPLRAVGEMREAADVGGRDDVRPVRFERLQLCGLELARELRLQQRIGAGRAAAQMRIGDRAATRSPIACRISSTRPPRLMPCCSEHGEWNATFCGPLVHRDRRRDPRPFGADHLDRVAREARDPLARFA